MLFSYGILIGVILRLSRHTRATDIEGAFVSSFKAASEAEEYPTIIRGSEGWKAAEGKTKSLGSWISSLAEDLDAA